MKTSNKKRVALKMTIYKKINLDFKLKSSLNISIIKQRIIMVKGIEFTDIDLNLRKKLRKDLKKK
jgi:hypothetical protein